MSAVTRICLLSSCKRVIVFCLLKLYMIFTLTEFLQFFYCTHRIFYFSANNFHAVSPHKDTQLILPGQDFAKYFFKKDVFLM